MYKNLCRICAKLIDTSEAQKLFDKRARKLLLQIEELTGLLLENIKEMPEYICECCRLELTKAVNFRELCIKTNKYLQKKIEETRHDFQKLPKDTNMGEQFESTIDEETPLSADQLLVLKYEPAEFESIDDGLNHLEDVNDKILEDDEFSEGDSVNSEEVPKFAFADDDCYEPSKMATKQESAIPLESNIPNGSKEIRKKQKKSTKSRKKSRSNQNQKVFICDQCGNHVIGRQHFKIHLRRHTGDKQFQCEVCPDKFFTQPELNRHMRRHTGERPFPCQHCGRRFTDYSTRVKHERTHTNERPFGCNQCTKAFTTSYILKNHMLTHTGERSFKCDLCNKAFQRKTNLVTHFRSMMHTMNVEKQTAPAKTEESIS